MKLETIFGKVLRSARIKKSISQEELAFESDLDRTYISMLERGIHQPTLETIFKLSFALKVAPSSLVKLVEIEYTNDKN